MIVLRPFIEELLAGETIGWVRPLGRTRLKESQTISLQSAKLTAHMTHATVTELEEATAGSLRATGDWVLPADWPDEMIVEKMWLVPAGRCERCRAIG